MTTVKLHNYVCAYIDILGGADLFRGKNRDRAADFFDLLSDFERRLNKYTTSFRKNKNSSALVKTFSDNIFVAFPLNSSSKIGNEDIVKLLLAELKIRIFQITLLGNFPLRGGISVGPLMFTDQFLFGPALVESVKMEKDAIFPRITLSPTALKLIPSNSPGAEYVIRDADGQFFLHYLTRFELAQHKKFVEYGLTENTDNVHKRQKYEWLAQYHNHVAKENSRIDQIITIDRSDAFTRL